MKYRRKEIPICFRKDLLSRSCKIFNVFIVYYYLIIYYTKMMPSQVLYIVKFK
jgi:hypothetical protein